jgi:uracil-DNA glycosylase
MGSVAIRHTPRIHGIRYMETCHPAAAMRFSKYRSAFCRAFRTLGRLLNVPKD